MDLKDFIKNSLSQIAEGIMEASETLSNTDAEVNPASITVPNKNFKYYARTNNQNENTDRVVEIVEFDVAITVKEGNSKKAGINISVMSIGLGTGGESSSTAGSQSRIKFKVPMVFPSKRK
jgi:hypothetical protein